MKKTAVKAKEKKATHIINYAMKGGNTWQVNAYSKTDLFAQLRDMMQQGYTEFKIKTL